VERNVTLKRGGGKKDCFRPSGFKIDPGPIEEDTDRLSK
jgi:hypothetical protein